MNANPQSAADAMALSSADIQYSISELSKEFEITTRAIRFYEDEGLIAPQRRGRQRIYSTRDYTRLKLILRGKRLGFSLGEIRDMLNLYDDEPGEGAQLEVALSKSAKRKNILQQQLEDIKLTLSELDEFENNCRQRLSELG